MIQKKRVISGTLFNMFFIKLLLDWVMDIVRKCKDPR
jgi:hypothetical protein